MLLGRRLIAVLLATTCRHATSFCQGHTRHMQRECCGNAIRKQVTLNENEKPQESASSLRDEAERLMQRAKELRETIPQAEVATAPAKERKSSLVSKWGVEDLEVPGVGYRLYVDIGREEGSWMDPRWGASGRRIEFTLDVRFLLERGGEALADKAVQEIMVKDNFGGKSSPVLVLQTASEARLRSGFDSMAANGGGYRVDAAKNGAGTARFYISVDGTPEVGSSFGDVSIPKGPLYFSIPCFGNTVSNLSTKEGIVSVRQVGWHTGWRREESRIAGVFRAVPIETARQRDGY